MSKVLSIKNVNKFYGKQKVLDNINLSLEPGEIMGLVGPNGAGKTTIMKIITRLIKNYDGDIFIGDENIRTNRKHDTKQIGCAIETPGFYPNLTGYENLLFFAEISGLKDKKEIEEIAKRLGIEGYLNKKVKTYSLGMRQRLGVAQAVLAYPQILILDEPTNGMDPAIIPQLREFIKYIAAKKGATVLISSHILSEIELMCDRVTFIQGGKIIKVEDLKKVQKDISTMAFVTSRLDDLKKFFNERKTDYKVTGEDSLQVVLKNNEIEALTSCIAKKDIPLRPQIEVKESLEETYLKVMEDEKNA
ncbi:bacitracin transport ATP-binding protein BrcA [Clostridium tetanomorphum DSM 665]|nr:bacitracin transport ATP-binding protein BrcA [Clostridium tetanomorphum DSM 665]